MTTDNPAGDQHAPIGVPQPVISSGQPAPDAGSASGDAAWHNLPRLPVPHATKFRAALAILIGIAVAALAVAVVVAAQGNGRAPVVGTGNWSSWGPDSSGSQGASEIAGEIAPYYRLDASHQLDVITPIQVSQSSAAGTTTGSGMTVVVNTSSSSKSESLDLLNGKTVAYNICGLGAKDCELSGTASVNRMLLLRREALELALYTFKYISGSQNVVVVLPPGRTVKSGSSSASSSGSNVTVAVLFVRKELQPWLNVPLSTTLQQYPLDVAELHVWSQTQEAGLVDEITAHGLFASQFESQQEGGRLLVLSQLPSQ